MSSESDSEDEVLDTLPFVGRHEEREQIKTDFFRGHRLIELYGPRMVGKAYLAKQVGRELSNELRQKEKELIVYEIMCKQCLSLRAMLENLSSAIGLHTTSFDIHFIINELKNIANVKNTRHLFIFFNCESFYNNQNKTMCREFTSFLMERLLMTSKRISCIVTSQKRFNFQGPKFSNIQVSAFTPEESTDLFRRYCPNVNVDTYKEIIETTCFGLPPLIMDAAYLIQRSQPSLTPAELKELLTSEERARRVHCESNSEMVDVFSGLSEFLRQRIIDISIFRGSFGLDQLTEIIDPQRPAEVRQTIIDLDENSLISWDQGKERFRLQPVVDYYMHNVIHHVTYDDTVRLRFVTLFGRVLAKADNELFIKPQQTVFGYLHNDWPNLRQVLKEAIHCTENTYEAFCKVSTSAETLLVKCFPDDAVQFYEAMSRAARQFGTAVELAKQEWLLGMAKTQSKGTDLREAMTLFKEALPVLRQSYSSSYCLVSLLSDMGLNYSRQGKYKASQKYFEDARNVARTCPEGQKLMNRVIDVRSYLAIPLVFQEKFDAAESLLRETLELTVRSARYHPSIPIMINSLGLIYERSGRDDDKALKYYSASLQVRRKYAEVAPGDLVVVLNNVAMQHSKRNNHRYALQLLSEALDIRKKIGWTNYHTGLTLWNQAHVYNRQFHFEQAVRAVEEAIPLFEKCTKKHSVIVEARFIAAHSCAELRRWEDCENYLQEIWKTKDLVHDRVPADAHILLALFHLTIIYRGVTAKLQTFVRHTIAELERLCDFHENQKNMKKYLEYKRQSAMFQDAEKAFVNTCVDVNSHVESLTGLCHICKDLRSRGQDTVSVWNNVESQLRERNRIHNALIYSSTFDKALERLGSCETDTTRPVPGHAVSWDDEVLNQVLAAEIDHPHETYHREYETQDFQSEGVEKRGEDNSKPENLQRFCGETLGITLSRKVSPLRSEKKSERFTSPGGQDVMASLKCNNLNIDTSKPDTSKDIGADGEAAGSSPLSKFNIKILNTEQNLGICMTKELTTVVGAVKGPPVQDTEVIYSRHDNGSGLYREPTENDERLDGSFRCCQDERCKCSIKK